MFIKTSFYEKVLLNEPLSNPLETKINKQWFNIMGWITIVLYVKVT